MNVRSNDSTELVAMAMAQTVLIERMCTLALEYHAKTITPERFALRVYEMLHEHDMAHAKSRDNLIAK